MIYEPLTKHLEENGYSKFTKRDENNVYLISFSSVFRRVQVSAIIFVEITTNTEKTHAVFDTLQKIGEAVMLERVDGHIAVSYEINLKLDMNLETQNEEQYIITINYDKIFNQTYL